MKFNGQTWDYLRNRYEGDPGFSPGAAAYISLTVINGTPYVAFAHYDNDRPHKAMVMKWDGIKWRHRGDPNGISEGNAHSTTIRHCPQIGLNVYVGYSDEGLGGKVVVKELKGESWEPVGENEISEGQANYPSLTLGQYCEQYVAYQDEAHERKLSVRDTRTDQWEYLGGPGFTSGKAGWDIQLQVENGIPYVLFRDETQGWKPTVMKYRE